MIQQAKWLVGLAVLAQSLTGCANSQFLKSMSLSVSNVNSEDFINLSTEVSMGNIALAELTVPIYDPNSHKQLGEISMGQAADGNQTLTLSLDATSVINGTSALGTTLPNGRALPTAVGGVNSDIVGIPVLDYSRVYIGGDLKSSIIVGMALSLSAFDTLSVIGNANIFFGETFNTSLSGVAGLFTSTTKNQSGVAVFAKYTAPATTTATANAIGAKALTQAKSAAISVSGTAAKNQPNTQYNDNMSKTGEQNAYNFMYGSKRVVRAQ